MKKVTRTIYVAKDGEEFSNEQKCKTYEANGCVHLEPIPSYCDRYNLTEQNLRWMLNGDGDCYYATATHRSRITPNRDNHPKWATHLVYFGK